MRELAQVHYISQITEQHKNKGVILKAGCRVLTARPGVQPGDHWFMPYLCDFSPRESI